MRTHYDFGPPCAIIAIATVVIVIMAMISASIGPLPPSYGVFWSVVEKWLLRLGFVWLVAVVGYQWGKYANKPRLLWGVVCIVFLGLMAAATFESNDFSAAKHYARIAQTIFPLLVVGQIFLPSILSYVKPRLAFTGSVRVD